MTSSEDRRLEGDSEGRGGRGDDDRNGDDDRREDRDRDDERDSRRDERSHDDQGRDAPADGRRRGKVARWNAERGFGFITPSSGGGPDVFCHITAINDGNALPEGGDVEFDVSFDDRQGKERAQNVTGGTEVNRNGGSMPRDPGGMNGSGKMNGTVARWNAERGFGFISPSTGGEDIFCHTTSIVDGNALPEGAKVTFDQEYDDKRAKDHAINVSGGCEEKRRDERGYDRGRGYDDRRDYDDDRRGGYDDRGRGGGYDDRRGGGGGGYDRHDDRGRGGYDDRRGGGGGSGGYERRGGYDDYDRRY